MAVNWLYLSPHFDDVALSSGGLIWEQVRQGNQVAIWTICGGEVPDQNPLSEFAKSLHARWNTHERTILERAREDIHACRLLGVSYLHLSWPDCIYRSDPQTGRPFVQAEEDLYKPYSPAEQEELQHLLSNLDLPQDAQIAVPFGIGSHRDHTVLRAVAEQLYGSIWHYPDYPYVVQRQIKPTSLAPKNSDQLKLQLSKSALRAWKEAVACYRSQWPIFWEDEAEMRAAIDEYALIIENENSGTHLWKF